MLGSGSVGAVFLIIRNNYCMSGNKTKGRILFWIRKLISKNSCSHFLATLNFTNLIKSQERICFKLQCMRKKRKFFRHLICDLELSNVRYLIKVYFIKLHYLGVFVYLFFSALDLRPANVSPRPSVLDPQSSALLISFLPQKFFSRNFWFLRLWWSQHTIKQAFCGGVSEYELLAS